MPATMHVLTPVLAVSDPRGLELRQVNYCRRQSAGPVECRVRGNQQDAVGRLLACRDPRLWALHQQDSAAPANLRQVHSLSGRVLARDSVDSGVACTLFGEVGQVVRFEDGRGSCREFEYDLLLRPVALHEQGAGQSRGCSERYSYASAAAEHAAQNACGRLLRHDDTAGSTQILGYSLIGEVSAQERRFSLLPQWPDWPVPEEERDALLEPEGAASAWRHGPLGDVVEQHDAAGNRQVIGLTLTGELRQVRVQLAGGSEHLVLVDARYNAFGQMEEVALGNGVHLQRRYRNEDGRLQQLSARRANGGLLQDLHYGYDPVGNVLSIEDQAMPVRHFANQRIEPVCTYAYDSLYQLIEATGWEAGAAGRGPAAPIDPQAVSNYRQVYDYDAGGNLLGLTHTGVQTHSRELVAAQYANHCLPSGQDFDANFDANGNLLQLQPGQALAWNLRNELREVRPVTRESGVDDWERYLYDAAGQRVRKLGSAEAARRTHTREVRYLPGLERHRNSREQFDVMIVQAGTCSVRILHWHVGRPDEVAQDQVRYALADHLGSSSLEVDADAVLISHEVFHPFGSTAWWAARNEIEAGYKTVRYSGKERDATGLHYYGARYYRTDWQRWLNPDPAGEADGLNLYCMVGNAPINLRDSDGRQGFDVNDTTTRFLVERGDRILAASLGTFPPHWQDKAISAIDFAVSWTEGARAGLAGQGDQETVDRAWEASFGGERSAGDHSGAQLSRNLAEAGDYLSTLRGTEGWRLALVAFNQPNQFGLTQMSEVQGSRLAISAEVMEWSIHDIAATLLHEALHAKDRQPGRQPTGYEVRDFWYALMAPTMEAFEPMLDTFLQMEFRQHLAEAPHEALMTPGDQAGYQRLISQEAVRLGLPLPHDPEERQGYYLEQPAIRQMVGISNADTVTGFAMMFRRFAY